MKGQNAGMRKKTVIDILLCVFAAFELFVCASLAEEKKSALEYSIEYEMSPLVLKRAEIINRQALRENYRVGEDEELYEVRLTYENQAVYTGRFLNDLSFQDAESGYEIYMAYPRGEYGIARQYSYNQVIPAKKTGSFTCFIAVPEETERIIVSEREEKLGNEGQTFAIPLPESAEESAVWNASE